MKDCEVNGRYEFVDWEAYRKVDVAESRFMNPPDMWLKVDSTTGQWTVWDDSKRTEFACCGHQVVKAGGRPPVAGADKWKVDPGRPPCFQRRRLSRRPWVEHTL